MYIVIAPNAFKGSLSAENAANCIAEGLRQSNFPCELKLLPIADGGDDIVTLLIKGMEGESIPVSVRNPLGGIITTNFGWAAKEKKAFISLSDASGLRLLKKEEYDPLYANTYGTGELIRAALDYGAKKIFIGVGGSATVDGATGLLKALGVRFFDESRNDIHDLPKGLSLLKSIDISGIDQRLNQCEIIVLCDVVNKLLGKRGAAVFYGPQKGANKKEIILLEKCLEQWNYETKKIINIDMSTLQHGGAGGGAAAGLAAFTNAKLVNGIEFFLDEIHFDKILENADLVITAEGSIDEQTLEGKGPYGVACRAKEKNIPVIGLAGQVFIERRQEMNYYFDKLLPINPTNTSLEEAMSNTAENLTYTAIKLGEKLKKCF